MLKHFLFFSLTTFAGFCANSLSLQLTDVTPLILGLIAPMLLLLRQGWISGLLSLAIVLLPMAWGPLWFLACLQFLLFYTVRHFQPLRLVVVASAYILIAILWLDHHSPHLDPLFLCLSALLYCTNFLMNFIGAKMLFDVTAKRAERSQQSLQQQLSSRIAVYSVVPACFLTLAALHGATVLDLSKNNAKHLQLTQNLSSELNSQLTGYIKQLELTRQHLDNVPQEELLRELVRSNSAFISALRTDSEGVVKGFYKEFIAADIRDTSVAHREYFQIPKQTKQPMVSDVFRGKQLGQDLLFAVSVPIFENQQFAGVLEVSVSLERLTSQFPVPDAASHYQFVLIDGANLKLWGRDQLKTPLGQPVDLQSNQLIVTESLFGNSWFNPVHAVGLSFNGEHLLQKTKINQTNWQLLQYSEMAPNYLRYELFQAIAQLLLVAMALLMRFSSLHFVKSYTDTLSQVIHSLEQVEPNKELLTNVLHRATALEFDELQTSFIKMQRRITQAHRQIQQVLQEKTMLSNELEQRVQQRTQELSAERDKANELALIKTRFLANMSHELRTPLTIIQGYAEQMNMQSLPQPADEQLKAIREHSNFLLHIVNDILDTAKIDEGKLRLDPQPIELAELLSDLSNTLKLLTASKGLNAEIELSADLPKHIIIDSFRLRQILMNLISNAVKFTEHGFVRFKVDYQFPELIIQVVDSGPGINAEQQQRIFQAFEQADLSTTRQFGGTGLGLYICRRLAELLDARLTLQSQLGNGSCFVLQLPISLTSEEQQAALIKPQMFTIDLSSKTILIVDDVAELRRLFQSMLANSNATILQASHGDEALAVMAKRTIDLVLLDMHMPVRDGMSTLKTMRILGYTQPVIALTADVQPEKHQDILQAGGQLVLTKPVSQLALLEAIQLTLKSQVHEFDEHPTQSSSVLNVVGYSHQQETSALQAYQFDELQLSFIESFAEQVEALQNAELVSLKLLLHKLKGTAACLELNNLSQLALQAELALKNDTDANGILAQLIAEMNLLLSQSSEQTKSTAETH